MKHILFCLIMINCFALGAKAQKKIEFDYPEEVVADLPGTFRSVR